VIYTFLLRLSDWQIRHKGKLPEVVFLQIDGGSENANQYLLGMCELLIAKRIIREIRVSRLVRGHTHEDIDGVFGHIWTWMRNTTVHTLDDFCNGIKQAFEYGKLSVSCEFLYAIPNYKEFLSNCIDKNLADYTKEENTQHIWLFEAVQQSPMFPFGVKTLYRAYASDKVIEFEKKHPSDCYSHIGSLTGLEPRTVHVRWYPDEKTIASRQGIEGFHLLTKLPDSTCAINPLAFIEHGVKQFEKAYICACELWTEDQDTRKWWDEWYKLHAPTATVENYYEDRVLRLPLMSYLVRKPQNLLNQYWVQSLNYKTFRNGNNSIDFEWPSETSVCLPSVVTSWTNHPGPSRMHSTRDTMVLERLQRYDNQTTGYYDNLRGKTVSFIFDRIIKSKIGISGNYLCSISLIKSKMINLIKTHDICSLRNRLKVLTPESSHYLHQILIEPLSSPNQYTEVFLKAGAESQLMQLTKSQVREFASNQDISCEVIDFIMLLHRIADEKSRNMYSIINSSDQDNPPKPNLFLSSSFLIKINETENIQVFENIKDYQRVFIPYKCDRGWICYMIDINSEKKIVYYDPSISDDVQISREIRRSINFGERLLNKYFLLKNIVPMSETNWPCIISKERFPEIPSTQDSAIAVLAFIDFQLNQFPFALESDDLEVLRKHYCYSMINTCLNT